MKKNASPELIPGWWRTNQPQGLSSAKDLEKALTEYQKSLTQLQKSASAADHKDCVKALDVLEAAAKKVQEEAEKALKSPPKSDKFDSQDYQYTVEALKKLPKKLEEARDDAEDLVEEEKGLLGNVEKYQHYLRGMLLKAKKGPLIFAFVAGAKAAEHRMMLHRRSPGTVLVSKLRHETGLKKYAFGLAGAHQTMPTTLVLSLETPRLPGLAKKCRALLKLFKPLPFDRVLLLVEGKEVEDIPDPEDTEPDEMESAAAPGAPAAEPEIPAAPPADGLIAQDLLLKFKSLTLPLNKAIAADPQSRDEVLRLMAAFKAQHGDALLEQARATLDLLESRAQSAAETAAAGGREQGAVAYGKARFAWQQARTRVRGELERLARKIVEESRDEPDRAEIEAGCDNLYDMLEELDERLGDELDAALNARSDEERQRWHAAARTTLDAYRAYVDSDDLMMEIDDNDFAPVKVRQTLVSALGAIAKALA